MSRRGGIQGRTAAMFKRLDEAIDGPWVSAGELIFLLEDEFDKPYGYGQKIVRRWAEFRQGDMQARRAGRTTFYCSRPRASLDPNVLAAIYWGQLPSRFRQNRLWPLWKVAEDDRLYMILMAYGWYTRGSPAFRIAFNKQAKTHGVQPVQK